MGNPRNRKKYLQHRSWFKVIIDGKQRIVRPVNGEDWFNEPGFSQGVVHLIDEENERVGLMTIESFQKNATRVGSND